MVQAYRVVVGNKIKRFTAGVVGMIAGIEAGAYKAHITANSL